MQVIYTNDVSRMVTVDGVETLKPYSVYAVIDGPADNAYHLFDVLVNVDDLVINVRGLGEDMPLVPTNGKAQAISEFIAGADGSPVGMGKRVTGPSVRSYVAGRAGRLTAEAYAVGAKVAQASA